MATFDLRQFVSKRVGPWSALENAENYGPALLRLSQPDDLVTLNGPLSVKVSIHVRNRFSLGGREGDEQSRVVASYRLDVPPGQSWTYHYPTSGETQLFALGSNARFEITLEPVRGGIDYYDSLGVDPYHAHAPCGCHQTPCSCQSKTRNDLPCDFAVGSHRNLGEFFPSACEPCSPGAFIHMPPLAGPRLTVPPASGGCTRTNYFNGMFISKEDLLTDQRHTRIKQQLQNRAMGQGVVWGLGVGLSAGSVVVQPGYAVDCCGQDITITSPYQVDGQALVHDPAAAAELSRGGPRRMHLLLEYFECPEDPRPVHGNPCSAETTHCEMGRIRETARLRLVPPRDLDTSGPIDEFLKSLPQPAPGDVGPQPEGPEFANAPLGTRTPFTLEVVLRSGLIPVAEPDLPVRPTFGEEQKSPSRLANFLANAAEQPITEFFVAIKLPDAPRDLFSTAPSVSVINTSPGGNRAQVARVTEAYPSSFITFSLLLDTRTLRNSTDNRADGFVTLAVNSWAVTNTTAAAITATGNTTITLTWRVRAPGQQLLLEVTTSSEGRVLRQRFPCLTEACDPAGGRLFPVTPPWMHAWPAGSGRAIDLQVLQGAFQYVRRLAGVTPSTSLLAVTQPLVAQFSKLFDAWCREALYRGPKCRGEPHGVVIGCAVVDGKAGRVLSVDPWGGRRWVVHFPLLTHWTGLAGVAPLDYLASKAFEFICCIASHGRALSPKLSAREGNPEARLSATEAFSNIRSLGTSQLIFDTRESLTQHTNNARITFRSLEFGEFLQHALNAVLQPTRQPIQGSAIVYTLQGFDNIFLVSPGDAVEPSQPDRPTSVGPVAPNSELDDLRRFTRDRINVHLSAEPLPRLLRPFTEELSIKLLHNTPVTAPSEDDAAMLERLKLSGVTTVSQLLTVDAEELLRTALDRKSGPVLAGFLDSGERMAAGVVSAVAEVVSEQSKQGLTVRDDLQKKAMQKQFASALTERLNSALPNKLFTEKAVRHLIEETTAKTVTP